MTFNEKEYAKTFVRHESLAGDFIDAKTKELDKLYAAVDYLEHKPVMVNGQKHLRFSFVAKDLKL